MHLKILDMFQFWGKATLLFSTVLWICSALSWYWHESVTVFLALSFMVRGLGLLLMNMPRHNQVLHGTAWFLEILLFWHIISVVAAMPFYWMIPNISWVDAYFEAMSGLTTGISIVGVFNVKSNVILSSIAVFRRYRGDCIHSRYFS